MSSILTFNFHIYNDSNNLIIILYRLNQIRINYLFSKRLEINENIIR